MFWVCFGVVLTTFNRGGDRNARGQGAGVRVLGLGWDSEYSTTKTPGH